MRILPILCAFCLLLAACGFEPVYGVNRNTPIGAESKLAQVSIDNIANHEGQFLRNQLIDRFYRDGYPDNPRYDLSIRDLREKISELDVTKASDSTRSQLRFQARMTLRDRRTGQKVLERELRSITSYNIVGSEFATRITEENARQNALSDIARQTEMQLNLYFKRGG